MTQDGPTPETDIWYTHESIIRKLYIKEKKTLKKVKEIMELEHGFPSFPLSTYGTKLRDQLKLPKKLKKKDWPVVYRHYQRRQADGKQTHMYLNDTFVPWEKAWKEIRRSRVPPNSIDEMQMPLPRGVMLKTPPPPPLAPIYNNSSQLDSMSHQPQSLHIVTNIEYRSSELLTFYRQLSSMCLENIPWLTMTNTLLGKTRPTRPTHATTSGRQFPRHGVEQIQFTYSNAINSLALTLPVPTSSELSTQLDPFHTLARAIYIISNNLMYHLHERLQELFDLLFARIPQQLVSDLFDSNLLSVQAAWEVICQQIHVIERRDTFVPLMKLGLSRPAWIIPYGHAYLSQAVSIGCMDIVRSLLQLGVRADEELPNWGSFTGSRPAVYEAIAARDTKCLELLVQSCDINRTILNVRGDTFCSFSFVLFSMGLSLKRPGSEYIDWRLELHQPSLRILLEHGANVDLPRPGGLFLQSAMQRFFEDNTLPYTRPSLLEHCYYYNKQMYYQLVPFSSRPTRDIYRDEICLAASMGLSSLLDYLTSKPGFDSAFLGRILAEQFFLGDKYFNSILVRTLLEFGVTINTSTPEKCFTALLCCIMRKARNFGFNEDDMFIMKTLLRSGALINSEVVLLAVVKEGTRTLDLISAFGANFRREGARALCKAARLNNFAAVSWLLRREVDINAAINVRYLLGSPGPVSVTVAAVVLSVISEFRVLYEDWAWEWCSSADCDMLKYLLDHGAKLWVGSLDSGPFEALRVILRSSWNDSHLFDTVHLILNRDTELKELPRLGFNLLEASLMGHSAWSETNTRSKVFEWLWKHGAPARPGGVLAGLIRCKAPYQLVLDLIKSEADINAYMEVDGLRYCDPIQAASRWWDKSLVSALLQHGANINSPALRYDGRTPLQAACTVFAKSEVDSRTQMALVQFMLRNNADVNAPAGARRGFTALQLAAYAGNIQLLSLLLSHGALVNTPNHYFRKCALDFAVVVGRLDALHFLLKAGALSYCHGQSGYEGAIRLARKEPSFAIVDSLHKHVRNNQELFCEQSTLAAAHAAAMEDRDWTDDMFSEEWCIEEGCKAW